MSTKQEKHEFAAVHDDDSLNVCGIAVSDVDICGQPADASIHREMTANEPHEFVPLGLHSKMSANRLADALELAGFQNVVADGPKVTFYFHDEQYEVGRHAQEEAVAADDYALAKEDHAYATGFQAGLRCATTEEQGRVHWLSSGLHYDDYSTEYKQQLAAIERQRAEALKVMKSAASARLGCAAHGFKFREDCEACGITEPQTDPTPAPDKDEAAISDTELNEIEVRLAQIPEGPYFVDFDDGADCPNHANSGLAIVETGRSEDWPIARHCHWPVARFIQESRTSIPKLIAAIRVSRPAPDAIRSPKARPG